MAKYVAEFQSISKSFTTGILRSKTTVAVKNVSFGIEEGETLSLIGANGAGKTTLIRMLLDFVRPTSGHALLFGEFNTITSLRDWIGYFPERVQYPVHLSVGQFLKYWGQFSDLHGEKLLSRINEVLRLVNLDGKKDVLTKDLSKGMAVRLGLAQALMNNPKLLILDEPTDGLDPLGRIAFRDILTNLKAEGRTIFMNSHILSEVEQVSTRVAILDKGELAAIDRLENLTSSSARTVIQFRCESHDMVLLLGERFRIEEAGDSWVLSLDDPNKLDGAIKELGRMGAIIKKVGCPRSLLEERFLAVVQPGS